MSDTYSYLGNQDAGTTGSEFNTRDFHIDQKLATVRTAILGQVMKAPYDASNNPITPGSNVAIGYLDVQPAVNQLDGYGNAIAHGTVYHLSYFRYQGGNGAFISDPVVGDMGVVLVCDRDISSVKSTGKIANPGSRRKFDLADGLFFGCPVAGAPKQWFAFLAKGFNCTDAYGNTMIGTADGVVINGATITLAGDVITKAGHDLDEHVHSGVTAGSDDTGKPV